MEELAARLSKLKRPSMNQLSQMNSSRLSNKKSVRDISFSQKQNTSYNNQASIITDNSERLRDTLEQFKKSKLLKDLRAKTKSEIPALDKQ